MENVMLNGFTELSTDDVHNVDGGFILEGVIAGAVAGAVAVVSTAAWCIKTNKEAKALSEQCDHQLMQMGYYY